MCPAPRVRRNGGHNQEGVILTMMGQLYPEFSTYDVLVTGGASGIGLAIADQFIENGARVIAVDNNDDALSTVRGRCGDDRLIGYRCDLTEDSQIVELAGFIDNTCGKLDVLVNCAGRGRPVHAAYITSDVYAFHFDILIKAPMLLTTNCIPLLRRAPKPSIVNIASMVSDIEWPSHAPYSCAKAALSKYTKHLARDLPGIRSNTINPGVIETPIYDLPTDEMKKSFFDSLVKHIPVGRVGTPNDIANVVLFVCSDRAAYIDGANIAVTGGYEVAAEWGL
jgi:NAD(P)-dependent dehydrogenase (short-subunit alcohol dehydrogenase family)